MAYLIVIKTSEENKKNTIRITWTVYAARHLGRGIISAQPPSITQANLVRSLTRSVNEFSAK